MDRRRLRDDKQALLPEVAISLLAMSDPVPVDKPMSAYERAHAHFRLSSTASATLIKWRGSGFESFARMRAGISRRSRLGRRLR